MPIVRVHRPNIPDFERAKRLEEVKRAMIEMKKEMIECEMKPCKIPPKDLITVEV